MTSCAHPTNRGAFCEAKVRSVVKQVKVRVAFRGSGNGTALLSSEYVRMKDQKEGGEQLAQLQVGAVVQARHPDKQEYLDATVSYSITRVKKACLPFIAPDSDMICWLTLEAMKRYYMYLSANRQMPKGLLLVPLYSI